VKCESGGRIDAVNPESTASGAFQILDSTWRSNTGLQYSRRAKDATFQQQLNVANHIYAQSGLVPWTASRHCWRHILSTPLRIVGGLLGMAQRQPEERLISDEHSTGRHRRFGRHRAIQTPVARPQIIQASQRYTVKPGDTLSAIATEHGHTWQQLFESNRATVHDPNLIHVGQILSL
jgi:nucleoid-associated protein YgaU